MHEDKLLSTLTDANSEPSSKNSWFRFVSKLEFKIIDSIEDLLENRKPLEFVLLDDDVVFLVKKENTAQYEFDDLDLENMGFSNFTISMFRDERFHFDTKNKL